MGTCVSPCPPLAASSAGVSPRSVRALTTDVGSRTAARSNLTTASAPLAAARCMGVSPLTPHTFTRAPSLKSNLTTRSCLRMAAGFQGQAVIARYVI